MHTTMQTKTAVGYLLALSLVGLTVIVLWFKSTILDSLPGLEQLENPPQEYATRVLDRNGRLIESFYVKRRLYVPYDSIPAAFFQALIATEDRQFYNHWGIHLWRIIKATVKNILAFRAKEGASTITQQLARNLYFDQELTLTRKLREAITAIQIEHTYTKNEILELYANTVNFGRGAYGIYVAAQEYFAKQPKQLTPAECAYLVALLKAPATYDAQVNYERALRRRNLVLAMMEDAGFLSAEQRALYAHQPISLAPEGTGVYRRGGIAPHFVEMLRKKLSREPRLQGYDLYRDGLTIETTLDVRIQQYANEAVREQLAIVQKEFDRLWSWNAHKDLLKAILQKAAQSHPQYLSAEPGEPQQRVLRRLLASQSFVDSVKRAVTTIQCGVVVLDPRTGAILAMVGASPFAPERGAGSRYSLNHCTEIRRQPGSAFKPFIYAAALAEGTIDPTTVIDATPFTYVFPDGRTWSPRGASHAGAVDVATALKFSINTVAARVITQYTTPQHVVALAHRMGITTPMDPYPALALGVEEVYPIELTAAFGTFVNGGIAVPPASIRSVRDRMGREILRCKLPSNVTDALSPTVCRTMIRLLQHVVDGGTGSAVRQFYRYDAAGKTGTTNDYADAWFVGMTPELVAGVWLGFDDQRIRFTGAYGMGGKVAAPIWGRLMAKIYADPSLGYTQRTFPDRDSTLLPLSPEQAKQLIEEDRYAPPPVFLQRAEPIRP
ncbi:MAG: PBP1A family penicillin-binding protein [Candidatus Kapabacteria bacterium]|nr:PBP1A family penicillin-binding protein [Candidatus Kapabacteria bacterium]